MHIQRVGKAFPSIQILLPPFLHSWERERSSLRVCLSTEKEKRTVSFVVSVCVCVCVWMPMWCHWVSFLRSSGLNTPRSDRQRAVWRLCLKWHCDASWVYRPPLCAQNSQRRLFVFPWEECGGGSQRRPKPLECRCVCVCVPACLQMKYNNIPLRHLGVCVCARVCVNSQKK